jgi:hypothetical protein
MLLRKSSGRGGSCPEAACHPPPRLNRNHPRLRLLARYSLNRSVSLLCRVPRRGSACCASRRASALPYPALRTARYVSRWTEVRLFGGDRTSLRSLLVAPLPPAPSRLFLVAVLVRVVAVLLGPLPPPSCPPPPPPPLGGRPPPLGGRPPPLGGRPVGADCARLGRALLRPLRSAARTPASPADLDPGSGLRSGLSGWA